MNRRLATTAGFFSCVAISLVLGLAGCGSDGRIAAPMQAQLAAQSGADPAVQGNGNGNAHSVSVLINGAVGGVVEQGHSVLTIPPGAFVGTRTITMVCDDAAGKQCRLYPEGLQFSVPVQLTMKLKGAPIDGPGVTIYWWDPMDGSWVDMVGAYNAKGHTVTANLHHFSLYEPGRGRVGW